MQQQENTCCSSSVIGIVSVIIMNACFNSATAPLIDGTINVVDLFTSNWLVSLLGNVIFVDTLCFAGFQNGIIIAYVLILLWSLAFYIVEIGEPKEEKISKKAKKTK